jgi:hypothetical protein
MQRLRHGHRTGGVQARITREHLPPEQLAEDILAKEDRIMEIMKEIRTLLNRAG